MYMSRVDASVESGVKSELARARILITGLKSAAGVDIARTFADLNARLVIHTGDLSPELIELVAVLSQTASEIRLHTQDLASADAAAAFARSSAQAFGGLDAAINIAAVSRREMAAIHNDADLEALIVAKLTPLVELTRIIANRMCVVLSEGLILNIFKMPHPQNGREAAVAALARTALASMTSKEAQAWAGHGIRINAVAPRASADSAGTGTSLTNEPEIAALALHLASRKGRALSGHIFDAGGMAS